MRGPGTRTCRSVYGSCQRAAPAGRLGVGTVTEDERDAELAAAVRAVTGRAERFERDGDREAVLGLGVLPAAAPLWRAATTPPSTTFDVVHALARLHWARCLAEQPSHGPDELYAALLFYARVGAVDPGVLPDEVRDILARGADVDHRFLGPEQWGRRAIDLLKRQLYLNDPAELDRVVDYFTATTAVYDEDHEFWPGDMANLTVALRLRYDRRLERADLERAVATGRRALRSRWPRLLLTSVLDALSGALTARALRTGNALDASEAVQLSTQAVHDTVPGEERRHCEESLAAALMARYRLTGDQEDLERSTDFSRTLVAALSDTDVGGALTRMNLGLSLIALSEATGRPEHLREAVELMTAAVKTTGPRHAYRPAALTCLSDVLLLRFRHSGDLQDLDDAVGTAREALHTAGERAPAGTYASLGNALSELAAVTARREHLDAAVDSYREAVRRTPPDHASYPHVATLLGNALLYRHEGGPFAPGGSFGTAGLDLLSGGDGRGARLPRAVEEELRALAPRPGDADSADLAEAAQAHRRALEAAGPHRPQRPMHLNNLGNSAAARFRATGRPADAEEAVALFRRTRAAAAPHDPAYLTATFNLAVLLREVAIGSPGPDSSRLDEELALWRELAAAPTAARSSRTGAAAAWGRLAATHGRWDVALEGYAAAIALLPSLASRGVEREVREQRLGRWSGLAGEAASCAIAIGRPERALELLEQGRAVLWSQLLDTRGDMDRLRATDPALADQLAAVEAELDTRPAPAGAGEARWWARAADRRLVRAAEHEQLLARARTLLADFRRPAPAAGLRTAAAGGPVVLVVVSRWRADALLVTPAATRVVPLPDLDLAGTVTRATRYVHALERYEAGRRDATARVSLTLTVASTLDWLWRTVAEPVLTVLGHTGPPAPGAPWPRLWWCPTGYLTLLPLHAAARAAPDGTGPVAGESVLDRVVPSYTPTLRALIASRAARSPAGRPGRLLAVGMPDTDGLAPLPQVDRELAALRRLFRAVTELRGHPWAHLSCHGVQDLGRPSRGGVVLADGILSVADLLADLHADRFGQGEFAFLSACRTALGGTGVPDEAVSLAGALQYAGWRHIVGTLWPVGADTAARVCDRLYRALTARGGLLPDRAAYALHAAVREVREEDRGQPLRWAAFAHFGA